MKITANHALLLCLVLATASGCGGGRRRYQDQQMDFGSVQKVAVVPFTNLSREPAAADRVRDVLANALLATNAVYVVPAGEVSRAIARAGIAVPATPAIDEVIKLGEQLKVEAIITGVVKEYGEVRAPGAGAASNVISVSLQMIETASGKVVWSASTTQGGVTMMDRMLGSGGTPLNDVTDDAVDDLISQMFK